MNPILQALEEGQALWLDYIRRDMLHNGELQALIAAGEIRGVTSNPSIFEQAIAGSDLYASALRALAEKGLSAAEIFENLAVEDIRRATDLFRPLYESSDGADGYVSLEVNPELAADSQATLAEARRLWELVNRPNLMIKIPATRAGIPAIAQAIAEGINVNVTLIFSLERYSEVIDAYLQGLETRLQRGLALDHLASVASFFISRVDSRVDELLKQEISPRARALEGKIAIANAKLAYAQFKASFSDERFQRLAARGARLQRPLWASTSTKNADYPDTLYLDNLIGMNTVNTVPPKTLEFFRQHGTAAPSLEQGLSTARSQLQTLADLGISLDAVTAELEEAGVASFAASYRALLAAIEGQIARLSA